MVDLTKYAAKGGCACKIGPHILADVLQHIQMPTHPAVLTDASGMEDAGVYQINESQAIVQTVDFFYTSSGRSETLWSSSGLQ